jgi:type IV secretory pathway VirB6-like protein
LLSKLLLVILLGLLVSKLGFRQKLKQLLPRLDRAVNLTIIGLAIIYVGQFLWWLIQRSRIAP